VQLYQSDKFIISKWSTITFMNINQKIVAVVTAVLIALMTLYPPFISNGMNGASTGYGYDWIFSTSTRATVNIELLLIQIFVALFVGGIFYLVLDKKNK